MNGSNLRPVDGFGDGTVGAGKPGEKHPLISVQRQREQDRERKGKAVIYHSGMTDILLVLSLS